MRTSSSTGSPPLTAIVSLMMRSGSSAPRNSACVPGRIEPFAIEILDVGGDVGFAPGDVAVASDRHRRRARQRGADDVEVAGRHVRQIPERGHVRAEMRIVGEQRLAAGGQRAVDDPVVRAERFGPSRRRAAARRTASVAAEQPAANAFDQRSRVRGAGSRQSCCVSDVRWPAACDRSTAGRSRMLRPSRGYGGISSAIRSGPTRGEQIVAQQLERVVRAQIPRHHLDPDEHVGPGPRLRLEAEQRELRRQRRP